MWHISKLKATEYPQSLKSQKDDFKQKVKFILVFNRDHLFIPHYQLHTKWYPAGMAAPPPPGAHSWDYFLACKWELLSQFQSQLCQSPCEPSGGGPNILLDVQFVLSVFSSDWGSSGTTSTCQYIPFFFWKCCEISSIVCSLLKMQLQSYKQVNTTMGLWM